MGTEHARLTRTQDTTARRTAAQPEGAGHDQLGVTGAVPIAQPVEVGHADDPAEHAADVVADRVVAALRRQPEPADERVETAPASPGVLRRSAIGAAGGRVDADVAERIGVARRGGGSPLETGVRGEMERAFGGANFGNVRVHAGPEAAALNESVGARAFTLGNDIFFRDGVPNVSTTAGARLLSHELAHTLQQPSAVRRIFGRGKKKAGDGADAKGKGGKAAEKPDEWKPDLSANPEIDSEHKQFLAENTAINTVNPDDSVEDTERTAGRWDVDPANVSAWNKKYVLVTEGTERYIVKKKDLRTTEHKKEKDPVFPTVKGQVVKPKPEDVVQGELGDCYLEAVLAAVAAKNPETIMGMIKDYGDSVTVRFYDVKRANPNAQPTFTPKYVRVEKSRARAGKELIYDQGALWVGLIEKAYAAGKFGSMASKAGAARAKATASYADIESGQEQHAFEVVLGRPASQHNLVTDGPGRWNTNHKDLPWSDDEINEWRNAQTTNTFTGLVANTVYQADDGKIMRWFAWLLGGTGKAAIDKVVDEANAKKERDAGDKTAYQRFAIRLEDWERVFTDEGLDAELAGPMLTYLKDFFPGKRGTGKYTKHQLATWDLINDALNNKKLVTAGTHKTQGRSKEGVGKSGGEEKSKGLAGGHAYTILDTAPGDNGRKLVKIRNPWGEYARVYDKTTGKAAAYKPPADAKTGQDTSEAAKGVSWLDLDDLLKRFDEITVS